jgi:hypothetical protein
MTRIRTALSALACTLLAAGCTQSAIDEPAPTTRVQPWSGYLADYRVRWSAEAGIDLLAGSAVFIRAYLESDEIVTFTADLSRAYPGFTEAVPPNEPYERGKPHSPGALGRFPDVLPKDWRPLVGNGLIHILSIDVTGSQLIAIVCGWSYLRAYRVGDGKYVSMPTSDNMRYDSETDGVDASRITLTKREGGPPPPSAPQEGPEPAPLRDVFGGWTVAGRDFAPLGVDDGNWPSRQADLAACIAKAPDPLERRIFLMTGEHPRSDFPTLPADPGWPLESN